MKFRQHTLPNGLEIIAECNPAAYSAALAFFVQTGRATRPMTCRVSAISWNTWPSRAHPPVSAADVNRELDEMGAHSNAFTSEEQTVYYVTVLPEYQDRAAGSAERHPAAVAAARRFRHGEAGHSGGDRQVRGPASVRRTREEHGLHFQGHPLARSVLGTLDSVSALSPDQMREYFAQRYVPNNMILAAAGNVDFDRSGATGRAAVRDLAAPARAIGSRPAPRQPHCAACFPNDIATQQYVIQIANGPGAEDDSRFAARILSTIVGDDSGSRFFWTLIDSGRAECAVMYSYEYQGTGIYMSLLCGAPEETADNLQEILRHARSGPAGGNHATTNWRRPRTRSAPRWCCTANAPPIACSHSARTGCSGTATSRCARSLTSYRHRVARRRGRGAREIPLDRSQHRGRGALARTVHSPLDITEEMPETSWNAHSSC